MAKCVMFNRYRKECGALIITDCEHCNFRKNAAEAKAGRDAANERIRSLPEHVRLYLMDKYHHGN